MGFGSFSKPWRDLPENSQENLHFLKSYQPQNKEVKHLRILPIGPVGAGKSSFINSVDSVLQNRITGRALTDADTAGSSFIKKYKTYKINKGPEESYPFVFNDTMGFERAAGRGVHVEDIKLVLKGHVKEGYKFKPEEPLKEGDFFNPTPTLDDRVHVLVSVVPTDKLSIMSEEDVIKMREVRRAASEMGIPQLAIITRIDGACPKVRGKINKAYASKVLKNKFCAAMGGKTSQPVDTIPNKMGRSQSKDIILDTFDEDWRKIPMSKDQYLDYVKNYQLHHDEIQHLRILLYGPTGAGKSSFINSVDTVLQCRMAGRALIDGIGGDTFTMEYRTFKIQKEEIQGTFYPFVFTDIMGLEKDTNRGVSVEDIKLAMKGHLRDKYKFNPSAPVSEEDNGFNRTPSLNDQVHVLVCVVSADTVSVINPEAIKKMRDVRLAARDLGIPQLAVLTKIDEACPAVKEDVGNVYKSVKVKQLMERLSAELGIPLYCIFPVKNYHWEITPEDVSDRLILSALKQMIDFGKDFVNNHM